MNCLATSFPKRCRGAFAICNDGTNAMEPSVSEAVGVRGGLKMAKANAKSQEPAFEGIGEKSRQFNRSATARSQEKRSDDNGRYSEAR